MLESGIAPPNYINETGKAGGQLTDAELHSVLRVCRRINSLKSRRDSSIVDLMKLLDLELGLFARDLLAQELEVNASSLRSHDQNIALYEALLRELAQKRWNDTGKHLRLCLSLACLLLFPFNKAGMQYC